MGPMFRGDVNRYRSAIVLDVVPVQSRWTASSSPRVTSTSYGTRLKRSE